MKTAVKWAFKELNNSQWENVEQIFEKANKMEKKQKYKYAIDFYKWLISQDGQDTIHDEIIMGGVSKEPTPEELLEQFKNK